MVCGPSAPARARLTESELTDALAANGWDVAATARQLALSRASLYDLIRRSRTLRTAADLGTDEIDQALARADGDLDAAAAELRVSARGLRRRVKGSEG